MWYVSKIYAVASFKLRGVLLQIVLKNNSDLELNESENKHLLAG